MAGIGDRHSALIVPELIRRWRARQAGSFIWSPSYSGFLEAAYGGVRLAIRHQFSFAIGYSGPVTDWLTTGQRRRVMQAIKGKDTGPELTVRRIVHRLGYRYRLHKKGLPGRPDLVLGPRKRVIFVHGCFWHAHDCGHGRMPESRQEYWVPKLIGNKERDQANVAKLEEMGWKVLTIWECEIKNTAELVDRLTEFLRSEPSPQDTD